MVGHGIGPANGAKVNGLVPADALFPVLGHHGSMTRIAVAAPIEMFPLQPNAKTRRGRVKHTQAFRHDFLSKDRKSVVSGKRVSVRVELGGRRLLKKKNINNHNLKYKK